MSEPDPAEESAHLARLEAIRTMMANAEAYGPCIPMDHDPVQSPRVIHFPRPELPLPDAVHVLNAHKHRGTDGWHLDRDSGSGILIWSEGRCDFLEPFEAIAIAEKYRLLENG